MRGRSPPPPRRRGCRRRRLRNGVACAPTLQNERSFCITPASGSDRSEATMRLTLLGWAGAELEADGATVVVDPLDDPGAVFAPLGERAAGTPLPDVVAPAAGRAVAGLVTHLHRDPADGGALAGALAPGAPGLGPPAGGGDALEELALAQAEQELAAVGVERRRVAEWESVTADPFTLTALPAVDGIGDPQVAWLVEADGVR